MPVEDLHGRQSYEVRVELAVLGQGQHGRGQGGRARLLVTVLVASLGTKLMLLHTNYLFGAYQALHFYLFFFNWTHIF